MSWSLKRKILIAIIVFLFLGAAISFPVYFLLSTPPTCFDNKQNGDENGIDCGGSCSLMCKSDIIDPIVLWTRTFIVAPGFYNAVAYVENPNANAEAKSANYSLKIYDENNTLITERIGTTYIPPKKRFAIFESAIKSIDREPKRAVFQFTDIPAWDKKSITNDDITIKSSALSNEKTTPRIDAVVQNKTLKDLNNIEFTAIIFDNTREAVGASKTLVESLPAGTSQNIVFTWPMPFATGLESCEIPSDIMVVLDRSGSMAFDNLNPPQPLTDVKNAALSFVDNLTDSSMVGVLSFATNASNPIDAKLSSDFVSIKKVISNISILKVGGLQQTNIGDALASSTAELNSSRHRDGAKKAIVLLTDGVPTRPLKIGDKMWPQKFALDIASSTKSSGISIYAIGLGKDVDPNYLTNLSSGTSYYRTATTTNSLKSIYSSIADSLCKKTPAVIEIIPKLVPSN